MATEKQIEANKENARLSTGPKTPEGKEASSKNALKYGIFSKNVAIPGEIGKQDQADYDELKEYLVGQYNPQTPFDMFYINELACLFIRKSRLKRYEAGSIRKHFDSLRKRYFRGDILDETRKLFSSAELDAEIAKSIERRETLRLWCQALQKQEVSLKEPFVVISGKTWNIDEDLKGLAKRLGLVKKYEQIRSMEQYDHKELMIFYSNHGYSAASVAEILGRYLADLADRERDNQLQLENEQKQAMIDEDVIEKLGSLPDGRDSDKIQKYEKGIMREIMELINRLGNIS